MYPLGWRKVLPAFELHVGAPHVGRVYNANPIKFRDSVSVLHSTAKLLVQTGKVTFLKHHAITFFLPECSSRVMQHESK